MTRLILPTNTNYNLDIMKLELEGAASLDQLVKHVNEQHLQAYQGAAVAYAIFHRQNSFGLIISDSEGKILEASPAACAALKRTELELQKSGWADITHPEDLGIDQKLVQMTADKKISGYQLLKRYQDKNGEPLPCVINVMKINGIFTPHRYLVIVRPYQAVIKEAVLLWTEPYNSDYEGLPNEQAI